jgi:2'-5' RNA ligase
MTKRLFLGLGFDPDQTHSIIDWRSRALTPSANDVRAHNLHVTLAFLGQVNDSQVDALLPLLDAIEWSVFSETFSICGYWGKPKIHFIAPHTPSQQLVKLAADCERAARTVNIPIAKRDYQPHVTLQRKITTPVPALFDPNITFTFDEFHLYESCSTRTGAEYTPLYTFRAKPNPDLTIREQLQQGLL